MARTRREKQHEAIRAEIKDTARALIAESGAAGISIRAIAREMQITAPALYHYYANRDELITALALDAFNALADAIAAVAQDETHATYQARLFAMALAFRDWALTNPVDFQLVYGNPIPGYEQPTDVTYPAARRSFALTASMIAAAYEAGALNPPDDYLDLPAELDEPLALLTQHEGHDLPKAALYLTASSWARMQGLISLELFNLIQPVVGDADAFYRHEITIMLKQMGLQMEGDSA